MAVTATEATVMVVTATTRNNKLKKKGWVEVDKGPDPTITL
jgi:hypothetical protein